MSITDPISTARIQQIGTEILTIAQRGNEAQAYFRLKAEGLQIADLQEAGFTEIDLIAIRRGWREVRRRIDIERGRHVVRSKFVPFIVPTKH